MIDNQLIDEQSASEACVQTPLRPKASPYECRQKLRELTWLGRYSGKLKEQKRSACCFWPFEHTKAGKPRVHFEGRSVHPQQAIRYLALKLRFKDSRWRLRPDTIAPYRSECIDVDNCLNVYHMEWDYEDVRGQVRQLKGPKPIAGNKLLPFNWER